VMSLVAWFFKAHHVASDAEQGLIENALAKAAFLCLVYWLIYLALEPWVRRYWPQTMITWSRVLAGKWRDPLVGRDLLFGTLFGIAYALLIASGLPERFLTKADQLGTFIQGCGTLLASQHQGRA